jgi:hypothetical protein
MIQSFVTLSNDSIEIFVCKIRMQLYCTKMSICIESYNIVTKSLLTIKSEKL